MTRRLRQPACRPRPWARPARRPASWAWAQAGTSLPASSRPPFAPACATSTPRRIYEGGNAERTIGEVLERTRMRKDVYLVTKNGRGKVGGSRAYPTYLARLERQPRAAQDRLRRLLLPPRRRRPRDPVAQRSRRQGRVREAQEVGQDQVLRPELPRPPASRDRHRRRRVRLDRPDHDPVQLPDHECRRHPPRPRRGLQGQPRHRRDEDAGRRGQFREVDAAPKFNEFIEKGFKKQEAAIKTVFADERVHVVVSEMTNRDMLRENMAASRDHTLSLARPEAARRTPPGDLAISTATAAAIIASRPPAESPSPTSCATCATTRSTASASAPASSTRHSRPKPATSPPPTWPPPRPPAPTACRSSS